MNSRPRRLVEVAIVASVVLLGCNRDRATCDGVGVTIARAAWPNDARMAEHVALRLARHCRDDHWSPEAIQCARQATRGDACASLLTPEQSERLVLDSPFYRTIPLPPSR